MIKDKNILPPDEPSVKKDHREARTVEQWRAIVDQDLTTAGRKNWLIMPRRVFSSRAYRALSLPCREILLCYFNKLVFEGPSKKAKRKARQASSTAINARNLVLTNNEIKARGGVKSDRTIASVRRELVRAGFLDVISPGSLAASGVFALSDRYLDFPHVPPPPDSKPVAFPRYTRKAERGVRGFPTERPTE
jgi:hypothetical protein